MSFPRYPEYKDSGVEWLGKVPGHWDIKRLKHLADIQNGRDYKEVESDEGYPVIGSGGPFSFASRFIYQGESVLLGRKGTIDRPLYVNGAFWAVDTMFYTVIKPRVNAKFLYYCTLTIRFDRYSTSTALPSMTQSDLNNIEFAVPCYEEQCSITAFLERETTKIDNLMAEQEKLIALLKEKRQAVIAHAVTKGLDPTVPMKDSGVEWLDEIPAHWQLKRVKHFVNNFDQGWSPQCESYPVAAEDEWGVLKVGCVNGGVFNPEENKSLPAELDPLPELGIRKGDLLISRANTRELVGSAAVVLRDYPNLLLCDKLYRLRLDSMITSAEFVAYYLSTGQVRGQIELSASGASSSMLNISQATILEMAIALPADEEQKKIVVFIESEQIKLNGLIAEAQRTIDLLKERRTALISAAVTGQIDVRGLIKEEQEQAA